MALPEKEQEFYLFIVEDEATARTVMQNHIAHKITFGQIIPMKDKIAVLKAIAGATK